MSGALLKVMNRATRIERLILLYPLRRGGLTSIYHQARHASAEKKETSIAAREGGGEVSMSVGEAVKETTKTVSYLSIIIAGLGVTGIMFYAIFRELFSSKSPNSVYAKALDKCLQDSRVQDSLGEPIKGFGEENSRGRRRYVSHIQYVKDGINHLRMQFYLKGSRKSGTVHLEVKEDSSGNYQYRYLFVQLDDYSRRVIILEDNRALESSVALTPLDSMDFSKSVSLS